MSSIYPFLFPKVKGIFISRINRFLAQVEIDGKKTFAYLPNSGKLKEILLPNSKILLVQSNRSKGIPYILIAGFKKDYPVLLHTHLTNEVVFNLIKNGKIPYFKGWSVEKREPQILNFRLDFRLKNKKGEILYLEVKTSTLFEDSIAMFPDALTTRGRKHLYLLKELSREYKVCCLFVVMGQEPRIFLPAYHLDYKFYKTFMEVKKDVFLLATSLTFDETFTEVVKVKDLVIPWKFLEEEVSDRGAYLLVVHLEKGQRICYGKGKERYFEEGFYVYVGSAMKNLQSRINRHHRKRKKYFWHIDYLLNKGKLLNSIPIRTKDDIECKLASAIKEISKTEVIGFGSTDCKCPSHLFYFSTNPLSLQQFQKCLLVFSLIYPHKNFISNYCEVIK